MNKSCYFSNPFNCYSWVDRPFQDPNRISFNLIQPNWLSEQIVLCGGALFISSNYFDACQNKAIYKPFFYFLFYKNFTNHKRKHSMYTGSEQEEIQGKIRNSIT